MGHTRGFEDLNPLPIKCPSCEQFGKVRLEGRWETAPGETCGYDAKLEYEQEHGDGSVTAWPYFVCGDCGCCWRGTKKADGGFSTANSPSPHARPHAEKVGHDVEAHAAKLSVLWATLVSHEHSTR